MENRNFVIIQLKKIEKKESCKRWIKKFLKSMTCGEINKRIKKIRVLRKLGFDLNLKCDRKKLKEKLLRK